MKIKNLDFYDYFSVRHQAITSFVLSFVIVFFYVMILNVRAMPADAGYYEQLSQSFVQDGTFHMDHFPKTFRGVIFPLILCAFDAFANFCGFGSNGGWALLISLTVAGMVFVLPVIFSSFIKSGLTLWRRMIPLLGILLFWHGLISYKLSDMLAIAFLLFGFACLVSVSRKQFAGFQGILGVILAGVFCYCAYNTRTIYLFPVMLAFPAVMIINRQIRCKKIILLTIAFLAGVLLAGSIEGLVNYNTEGVFSIAVKTDNLFGWQLTQGMTYAQYETYISENEAVSQYPMNALKFVDPVGTHIYNQLGLDFSSALTVPEMAVLILKHPFAFAGIYIRHFINMLNPVWGGAYITNIYKMKIHLSIINYSMIFLIIKQFSLQHARSRHRLREKLKALTAGKKTASLILALILLPCLCILPGAVESRFFIPMYLVLYAVFAYLVDMKTIWRHLKERPVINAGLFILGFAVLSSIWSLTYASTEMGVYIGIF